MSGNTSRFDRRPTHRCHGLFARTLIAVPVCDICAPFASAIDPTRRQPLLSRKRSQAGEGAFRPRPRFVVRYRHSTTYICQLLQCLLLLQRICSKTLDRVVNPPSPEPTMRLIRGAGRYLANAADLPSVRDRRAGKQQQRSFAAVSNVLSATIPWSASGSMPGRSCHRGAEIKNFVRKACPRKFRGLLW
jgi:hypothetical protein